MNTGKKILVGAGMAVFLTAASFVTPGGMLGAQDGGVGRTTPSVSPFPTSGTVPVVTTKPKSSVSPSGAVKRSAAEKTHESSVNAPYGDADAVRAEARIIASHAATLTNTATKKKAKPKTTYIKGYSFCGWSVREAQRCIDQGKLVRYKPAGVNTLAGHNYKGWYWIDDIPTGRIVVIQGHGQLAGKYKVYGHAKVYNKKFPKSGLGADVALQTCEGSGIGFSFLRRV